MTASDWELVGVPYTSAAQPGGIARAISVLRADGLAEQLRRHGVVDGGDLDVQPPDGRRGASGLLNEPALAHLVAATAHRVRELAAQGRRALLVGGDCPVLLGALAALRDVDDDPGLVMLDGHEDAWPPNLSSTGEASDSELAIALGLVDAPLPSPIDELAPLVRPSSVALLGPRDRAEIDAGGARSLRTVVARFADPGELRREGVEMAMAATLAAIAGRTLWLHIDLDVLAADAFAAVDYPQPGGLEWDELDRLVEVAVADPRCVGASVAIYNPTVDGDGRGSRAVIEFVSRIVS